MKVILLSDLEKFGACQEEIDLFVSIFGTAVLVTVENIKRAHSENLSIFWLLQKLNSYNEYKKHENPIYFEWAQKKNYIVQKYSTINDYNDVNFNNYNKEMTESDNDYVNKKAELVCNLILNYKG